MSLHLFIEEAFAELRRGAVDARHPFRFFTLGTQSRECIDQRMVVLRSYDHSTKEIVFFTDSRSKKVEDLKRSSHCHALFWHSKKKLQIRLACIAALENPEGYDLPVNSLKDYNSKMSPGQKILEIDDVVYHQTFDTLHFQPIRLKIKSIDILQLDREQHLRAWGKIEKGILAETSWLVP